MSLLTSRVVSGISNTAGAVAHLLPSASIVSNRITLSAIHQCNSSVSSNLHSCQCSTSSPSSSFWTCSLPRGPLTVSSSFTRSSALSAQMTGTQASLLARSLFSTQANENDGGKEQTPQSAEDEHASWFESISMLAIGCSGLYTGLNFLDIIKNLKILDDQNLEIDNQISVLRTQIQHGPKA